MKKRVYQIYVRAAILSQTFERKEALLRRTERVVMRAMSGMKLIDRKTAIN